MTIVQYLRGLLVLLAMPVVTTVFFHPAGVGGTLSTGPTRWPPDLLFVALAVGAGAMP